MVGRKSAAEIEKMRVAGRVVAEVLQAMTDAIVPGVTKSIDLDRVAATICQERGAKPAFLGYHGFPACTCISINEAVVHGIPGERVLQEGDIVALDFACSVDGYFADAAVTVPVGEISPQARKLLIVTRECLEKGIAAVRAGGRMGDVSAAVQRHAESAGFSVVRELVGHGIGRSMHEEPEVPNYGRTGKGIRLSEGMTFALEPMINQGTRLVETLADHWTVVTKDGKLAAHFEHTIAVTRKGADVLTLPAPARTPGVPAAQDERMVPERDASANLPGLV